MSEAQRVALQQTGILEDLVKHSLRIMLLTTVVLMWTWALAMDFIDRSLVTYLFGLVAVSAAVAVVSYWLHERHLNWAISLYLLGLIGIVAAIGVELRSLPALYLYVLVVLMAIPLASARITWIVVGLCITMAAVVGIVMLDLRPMDVALLVTLILLGGFSAWLSSRQLITTLAWTLEIAQGAQRNAEEARKQRAELHRVLKTLDSAYTRLERMNRALLVAQESAERAYRFKAEFVANVSHELRTPLNLIVGFSEMMVTSPESYGSATLPREYRGDVMAIFRSARHLLDLINDVLDLSQLEAGKLSIVRSPAQLPDLIHEAADIVRGLAEARGLRLSLSLDESLPTLTLDRTRIRQVLLNLMTNAIRFTDVGGVHVSAAPITSVGHGNEILIQIADTGHGIDPENLKRAFEAFSQLHEDQVTEGSGLGLAISKKYVEMHEGRIWIESSPGQGTTLSFTLPAPTQTPAIELSRVRLSRSLADNMAAPLVLTLHDDLRIISWLQRHLAEYKFVLAQTPQEAASVVRESMPEAVLVDAYWLKHWPSFLADIELPEQIPVIMCTLPSLHALGSALGAVDMLQKPVTRDDLAAAFARLATAPQKVLIVDDDPNVVRLLHRMIVALQLEQGMTSDIFESFGGQEAMEIIRTHQPDLVLLDLAMPGMSGLDFLRALPHERNGAGQRTQVIIISAFAGERELSTSSHDFRLWRAAEFSLTDSLRLLASLLTNVTGRVEAPPASDAGLPERQLVRRAL